MNTDIWIKHASDKSTWPNFPAVIHTVDGLSVSDIDTAFDAVMRAVAGPDTRVFVGPGLFLTRGACGNAYRQADAPGFRLQTGARLVGAGMDGSDEGGTTLRLVACNEQCGGLVIGSNEFDFWESPEVFQWTAARGIEVSDLLIDCNAPEISKSRPGDPWYIQAVQIYGTDDCRIDRVATVNATAIGPHGSKPETECFILSICSPPGESIGNVICDCSVSEFYNPTGRGCCSAISTNCWQGGTISGKIIGCSVVLNGDRGWGFGGEFAYNAANAKSLMLSGNWSKGAARAFNNDTKPNEQLLFVGNFFDVPAGSCQGVVLQKPNPRSRFLWNRILLRSADSSGFLVDRDANGNDLFFSRNKIVAVGTWNGPAYGFNLHDNLEDELVPTNVHLEGNALIGNPGARIDALVSSGVGYQALNTVNGVEFLWPVTQPNPGWEFESV